MVDKTSGKEKRVFEGGAMLLYLTEKYDKDNKISFDHDSDEYWETVEWLVWMQSGLGPMQVGEPLLRIESRSYAYRSLGSSQPLLPLCSRED
jgi:glutathione S-transferase